MNKPSPIISAKELLLKKEIILVDARAGADAKERYMKAHLQSALHVDLDSELADVKPNAANGGRHPLPSPQAFCKVLNRLGISPESHVVIYDDKNCSNAAARFWWMLKAIGHTNVSVLDGGFDAAVKEGFPISSKEEIVSNNKTYNSDKWLLPMADMSEVENVRLDINHIIIDVRDKVRYDGIKEPIDLIAGHIPGAINIPFTENLNMEGFYLSPEELKNKYAAVFENKNSNNVIVHCGSGVTACHTLLAMAIAGYEIPKLYVGSWSEWSRNDKVIATK